MSHRTLEALGLAQIPAVQPLSYPGRPISEPSLLHGNELLPLRVSQFPLHHWKLASSPESEGAPSATPALSLDEVLTANGQAPIAERYAVLSVGSNASPAQLRNKLRTRGIPVMVPMLPIHVQGIGVGYCAHIYPAGYVATAPFVDKSADCTLVVTWLDAEQFRAVDETEIPFYKKALVPGSAFPLRLPSGAALDSVFLYASAVGILTESGTAPRRAVGSQHSLLSELLALSPRLQEAMGPDPDTWVRRAAQSADARAVGSQILQDEGWVLTTDDFSEYLVTLGDDVPTG